MDRKDKILQKLYDIQKRPGMYMQKHEEYDIFCSFMEGWLLGLTVDNDENNYLLGTVKYFASIHDCGSSVSLSHLINIIFPKMSSEEKCSKYIQTIIDYFENTDLTNN